MVAVGTFRCVVIGDVRFVRLGEMPASVETKELLMEIDAQAVREGLGLLAGLLIIDLRLAFADKIELPRHRVRTASQREYRGQARYNQPPPHQRRAALALTAVLLTGSALRPDCVITTL